MYKKRGDLGLIYDFQHQALIVNNSNPFKRFKSYFLSIAFLLFSSLVFGQTLPKTLTLNIEDGLLQSTVWAIEEDDRNRIWIGTPGGIQIYDGFNLLSLPEIEGTILRLQKHDGFMYCITISALYKFDMETFSFQKSLFPQTYFYLHDFLKEGIVLLDDKDSLFYYYGYDLKKKNEIPKRREIIPSKFFEFSLNDFEFVGGVNGTYTSDSIIISTSYCKQFVQYDSQTAFIATHKGLIKVSVANGKLDKKLFFEDIRTTHLLVDRNKNLWVATADNGIFMVHRNSLKSDFFSKKELDGSQISCWSLNLIGDKLYTHANTGLIPVQEEQWRENNIYKNTKHLSALNSVQGNGFFLVGTRSDGIYKIENGNSEQIHFNKFEQVDNIIVSLQKSPKGFLATSKYSFIRMNERGEVISKKKTDFDEVFGYSMDFLQNQGDILNSRTTGLALLDSALELKNNYHGDSVQVVSMVRPFKEELWGVSMDAGLLKLEGEKLIKKKFPDKHLFTLTNWKDESLWISGVSSIYQYSDTFTRPFTPENGFPIREYNQGGVFHDSQGNIYFSGVGGVQKFHPDSLKFFPKPPAVILKKESKEIQSDQNYHLDFDQSQLILDVLPISISDQNYFKIEIEVNGEIIEIQKPKNLSFSLPYGSSRLILRIKDLVHETETSLNYYFYRSLPFWKKSWFIGVLIILAIVLIIGVYSFIGFLKSKRQNKLNQIRIEEQQKGLSAIIHAQEEERKRIAKDLHDGIVQQLGGLKLGLQRVFSKMQTDETQKIVEILDDSTNELRALSHQMMPRALGELGLIPALTDMLENSLGNSDISYKFEHFGIEGRLKETVEIAIYRIAQELVNNVIKHSSANKVNIQLMKNSKNVVFIVEDNGRGMNSSESSRGIGLMNIASRLDSLKGIVNFEPSPESGTLATIRIPLEQV